MCVYMYIYNRIDTILINWFITLRAF